MMRLWRVPPQAPVRNERVALHDWLGRTTDVIVRPDRTLASP
jgi:hypothetical protein